MNEKKIGKYTVVLASVPFTDIFEKLGVASSVEAVTKAIQMGYIPPNL